MKRLAGVVLLAAAVLVAAWMVLPYLKEAGYLARHTKEPVQALTSAQAITPQNAAQITQVAQRGWGLINDVAWAPDSRSLALATTTGIRLVEAGNLNLLIEIPTDARVLAVAFSPDGRRLAGALEGEGVVIWQIESLSMEMSLEVPRAGGYEKTHGLQFSDDGRWVAVTWHRILYVWEVQTGRLWKQIEPQEPNLWIPVMVSFIPGQGRLLYADQAGLYTLDMETYSIEWVAPFEHKSDARWAVDAAGNRMALDNCGELVLFESTKDTPHSIFLQEDGCLVNLVFSADGQQLAVLAASGSIYLIKQDGSVITFEPGEQSRSNSWETVLLRFSPDGQSLAWVAAPWAVYLYHTADGSLAQTLRNPMAGIQAVHLEAGEQGLMLLNESDRVSLVQITPEKTLAIWEGDDTCAINYSRQTGFSADGSLVWLQQCTGITLRETATGNLYGVTLPTGEKMALSPDGDRWATAYMSASSGDPCWVKVYRTRDGKLLHQLRTYASPWRSLQFSPDGQLLLAVEYYGDAYLWAGGSQVFPWVSGMGWYGAFTPDGLTLASGSKIVNLSTRAESRLPFGEQSQVAVSPDGRLLARRAEDGTIELWDMAQVELLHTLKYLPGWQAQLAFSSDGSRLMVVVDGMIAFWGVENP